MKNNPLIDVNDEITVETRIQDEREWSIEEEALGDESFGDDSAPLVQPSLNKNIGNQWFHLKFNQTLEKMEKIPPRCRMVGALLVVCAIMGMVIFGLLLLGNLLIDYALDHPRHPKTFGA